MGQARLKMLEAGKLVAFDFSAPKYHIVKGDREALKSADGGAQDRTQARATRFSIVQVVQAAFPQGMDRKDGKVWAAWQETLDDEGADGVDVNRGMVSWLLAVSSRDELKVAPSLAQWREALVDYLEALLIEPPEGGQRATTAWPGA